MGLLILGVLLWSGAHVFKRVAPDARAKMGDRGMGVVAIVLVVSIVLMVVGYRGNEAGIVYVLPEFARHINNLLVLIAIYLMSPAPQKGVILNGVRHPQLLGFSLWAVAHLLVNGDWASIILFGGLLIWALAEIVIINRAEPTWAGREKGAIAKDAMFFGASIVLLVVIGLIHGWIGPSPFPM